MQGRGLEKAQIRDDQLETGSQIFGNVEDFQVLGQVFTKGVASAPEVKDAAGVVCY